MWNHVTKPFQDLLAEHLYPALYGNADYRAFLAACGIHAPYPRTVESLSPPQRLKLRENAHLRSHLLRLELESLGSMTPQGAKALELAGPLNLFRLWNSAKGRDSELKFFWFREELLAESIQQSGGQEDDQLEWLRARLAVAYNWSLCDRIARLHLGSGDVIPAVEAIGLPVRAVQIQPGDREIRLPSDPRAYYANYAKYSAQLPGGAPQLFLFLLPEAQVVPYI